MTSPRYDELLPDLRQAYDRSAAIRDATAKDDWKIAERTRFADRLRAAGLTNLLEIGAGTGQDSAAFRDEGFAVRAIDASPGMVELCRAKGLDAQVMDFLRLDFPAESFDAVYAMNCLLHVPNADLPAVLEAISRLLQHGGLFFLGVYGGKSGEGIADWDLHDPPRFFSWRTDGELERFVGVAYEIIDFHVIGSADRRFQSMTLTPRRIGNPGVVPRG